MTQDFRIDRLEGVIERVTAEQSELRQDMRDLRSDIRTLLVVNIGLWATTIAAIIGLFFKGG